MGFGSLLTMTPDQDVELEPARLAKLDVFVVDPLWTGTRNHLLLVEARRVARHAVRQQLALQRMAVDRTISAVGPAWDRSGEH